MSDPAAPEHFADWNEQMVRRYDPDVFHHHPTAVVRWVEARRVAAVLASLQARPEHRLLDAGCGAGNLLARLPCAERFGIDLSSYMVQRARERHGGAARIEQGDAEQLPFEDASFDRVVASSLLSHVLHPERVVGELRRVTKPGGRIVISISQEEKIERGLKLAQTLRVNWLLGRKDEPSQAYNVEYHLHRFSLARLREVAAGKLTQIRLRKVPFFFPVHIVAAYTPGQG